MTRRTVVKKRDFNQEFQEVKKQYVNDSTKLGDLVYMYSGGQGRDFYRLNVPAKEQVLKKLNE